MKHHVSKSLEVDGLVYLDDVYFTFEVTTETYPAEPYSWGGNRGTETEITDVDIIGVQVGGLTLTDEQATKMFGPDAIEAVRERISFDDL